MSSSQWQTLLLKPDTKSAGEELAQLLLSNPDPLGELERIVIDLIDLSCESPASMDRYLNVFASFVSALQSSNIDPNKPLKVVRFYGADAARKALGIELVEDIQNPSPVPNIDMRDVTCAKFCAPNEQFTIDELTTGITKMAESRRSFLAIHAIYARARTLNVVLENDPDYDMGIAHLAMAFPDESRQPVWGESTVLGAAIMIIASGSSLAGHWNPEKRSKTLSVIVPKIEKKIKDDPNFHVKVVLSTALKVLKSGEEGWSSERLFGNEIWVY